MSQILKRGLRDAGQLVARRIQVNIRNERTRKKSGQELAEA